MNSVRFMISKEENLASGPNKSLITQSFCVAEIYYSEKRTENASDTDTSERQDDSYIEPEPVEPLKETTYTEQSHEELGEVTVCDFQRFLFSMNL